MLIVIVVIASIAVLSSAQPSSQCITAYNDTFDNPSAESCAQAYTALGFGNATDQQRMMVCDAGQQCNTLVENVINTCGYSVSLLYSG